MGNPLARILDGRLWLYRLSILVGAVVLSTAGSLNASPGGFWPADMLPAPAGVGYSQTVDTTDAAPASAVLSDRADRLPGYVETALRELIGDYTSSTGVSLTLATVDSIGSVSPETYVDDHYPGQSVLLLVAEDRAAYFVGSEVSTPGQAWVNQQIQPLLQADRPAAAAVQAVHGLMSRSRVEAPGSSAEPAAATPPDSNSSGGESSRVLLWVVMIFFCSISVLAAPKLFFMRRYSRWYGLLIFSLSFALGGCIGSNAQLSVGAIFGITYLIGFNVVRFYLIQTRWGEVLQESIEDGKFSWLGGISTASIVAGTAAVGAGGRSGGSGGFSGGGGSFGGGGATGSW